MHDLDLLSYCILRPGAADQVLLPLWPGSVFTQPREYEMAGTASNIYGAVNATQRVRHPVFYLRCPLFDGWFNQTVLAQMFGRQYGSGEIIGRDRIGNYGGSLGAIQWRYANETPIEFAACKVQTLLLSWSGADAPIEAWIAIRPYGWRRPPSAFRSGQYTGRPWRGANMTHAGVTGMWSGTLRIDNNLVANDSSPHFTSYDQSLYPVDYASDSTSVACQLTQATLASSGIDALYSDGENDFLLTFKDPTASIAVNCQLNVLQPDTVQTIRGGNGIVTRLYQAIRYDALTPRLRFF